MKNYRSYYIDGVAFTCKADIDNFIKELTIESYKRLCFMFANNPSMELCNMMSNKADYLHSACGLSYDEIEAIEIEASKAA